MDLSLVADTCDGLLNEMVNDCYSEKVLSYTHGMKPGYCNVLCSCLPHVYVVYLRICVFAYEMHTSHKWSLYWTSYKNMSNKNPEDMSQRYLWRLSMSLADH